MNRITAFENYVICFAWTDQRKYPLIIFDITELKKTRIVNVVNCGVAVGEIKIEEDI